jgi:hypothetical protein
MNFKVFTSAGLFYVPPSNHRSQADPGDHGERRGLGDGFGIGQIK